MTFDLAAEAGKFGEELQQLLDAVLPYEQGTDPELRQVTVTASRLTFAIEIGTAKAKEAKTIPLLSNGRRVAELFVLIRLVADSADRYPAVAKSKFELRVNRHPLLRLDFDRDMHTAPGCHWNVHAERCAITNLLVRNNPDHSGELCKLHLPVGGARMRPCLEDLLQLLAEKFRFDAMPGALRAIEDGRVKWRRRQLAAMVRDDPEEAIRVLTEELGYEVTPPTSGARGARLDRLRRW
ncbi:MAG: hypothetical protein ACRDRA_02880 [Pseudonocardiaceae bacterium]